MVEKIILKVGFGGGKTSLPVAFGVHRIRYAIP
jgi:hypothetical protein